MCALAGSRLRHPPFSMGNNCSCRQIYGISWILPKVGTAMPVREPDPEAL